MKNQIETDSFPPGLKHAYWFSTFNALSYQMILGSPMVLYAKSLDASATVLGIVAGMMPLLVIFQIPAASHVSRIGFKKFVYAGWGTRVMFIFFMALVPLTGGFLNPVSQLALLIFLLFGFNLSRGISSCAWLPWITALVPAEVRGRYLARDQACVHVASFATLLLAAFCLGQQPRAWQFAVILGYSGLMGAISLSFLKRIPDADPPEEGRVSGAPVPWVEISRFAPFRKLLRLNVAWALAYGGLGAFTVAYLKAAAGMGDGKILFVTGMAYLGGLSGLWLFASRTDRLGSKPVMTFALLLWLLIMVGWALFAAGVLSPKLVLVLLLELLMGLAYALVNTNNTRLAMVLVPVMGRNHFFALFSVVQNVTLGIAPMLWGLLLDAIGTRQVEKNGLVFNRFGFFFAGVFVTFLITLALCRRLDEPKARNMEELLREVLIQSPQRVWVRLWPKG